jgi:hypothetical protein
VKEELGRRRQVTHFSNKERAAGSTRLGGSRGREGSGEEGVLLSLSLCRGAGSKRPRGMRESEELPAVNCHDDGEGGTGAAGRCT